ncbi:biopolymer transporter ExbD [uncultured Ferrimonas sp.]|uniref:ExbD/TolR family protein n=1 Tax=uncultured Ferrimonas sp. TaxID=432640 RepID=UPI0026255144|nr:biopolymer transporter ExbD [uncultured Ferrimonas sp.]
MIRSQPPSSGLSEQIDLTSLIDIIFIVLVFLLLTANTQLMALPVDVPQQQETSLVNLNDGHALAVNVLPQAPYYALNQQPFGDFDQFKAAFIAAHKAHPERTVVVAADSQAPVQPLMKLLALLQAQRIDQTQIVMEE